MSSNTYALTRFGLKPLCFNLFISMAGPFIHLSVAFSFLPLCQALISLLLPSIQLSIC